MPVPKPIILDFYEFDVSKHSQYLESSSKFEKFKIKCKFCDKQILASVYVTSNWITHLKAKHTNEFNQYNIKKTPRQAVSSFHIRYIKRFLYNFSLFI